AVNSTPQTAEITNLVELEVLTRKLYDQLDRGWQTSPTFENNLVYRVRVRPDGAVAGYEPLNQAAKDYVQETPLSAWQPSRVNADTPRTAQFTVVFSPSGVLEVSH
ncbi:MAG: nitrate ABC transporter ATP-binding protein, partial [Actinomycetota bacterium]